MRLCPDGCCITCACRAGYGDPSAHRTDAAIIIMMSTAPQYKYVYIIDNVYTCKYRCFTTCQRLGCVSAENCSVHAYVRACVRASEAACVSERKLLPWLCDFHNLCSGVPRVPFPSVGVPCPAFAPRRAPSLLGCFPLLPVAPRGFLGLPLLLSVASRARLSAIRCSAPSSATWPLLCVC